MELQLVRRARQELAEPGALGCWSLGVTQVTPPISVWNCYENWNPPQLKSLLYFMVKWRFSLKYLRLFPQWERSKSNTQIIFQNWVDPTPKVSLQPHFFPQNRNNTKYIQITSQTRWFSIGSSQFVLYQLYIYTYMILYNILYNYNIYIYNINTHSYIYVISLSLSLYYCIMHVACQDALKPTRLRVKPLVLDNNYSWRDSPSAMIRSFKTVSPQEYEPYQPSLKVSEGELSSVPKVSQLMWPWHGSKLGNPCAIGALGHRLFVDPWTNSASTYGPKLR